MTLTLQPPSTDERKARPSASGIERIALCPGSWQLEQQCPEPPESEYAAEGTKLHAVLAGEISGAELTDDQRWCVERCIAIEREIVEGLDFAGADCIREERGWVTYEGAALFSGKPDAVYFDRESGRALVVDYKTGRGEVTAAESNYQMRALAVLISEQYGACEVTVVLVHPRLPEPLTICRYGGHDINVAFNEVREIIAGAEKRGAPRIPGEKQCRYCRAVSVCPEARQVAVALVPPEGWVLPQLNGPELSELLPMLEIATRVIKAVEARAKQFLASGGQIPGYALKPGATKRAIPDAEAAYQKLAEHITPELFARCCTVAIGKLETVLSEATALKGKALGELVAETLGEAIVLQESQPSLVRVH